MSMAAPTALERSLEQAVKVPGHRPQFFRDLLESEIVVLGESSSGQQTGRRIAGENESLHLQVIVHQGCEYIPIFSSISTLADFAGAGAAYIAIGAREFLEMTRGKALLLNPGGSYGKELFPEEIAAILDGRYPGMEQVEMADAERRVVVGLPAKPPLELMRALESVFRKHKAVARAYLLHFYDPADGHPPHSLVAIEMRGDPTCVMEESISVAEGVEIADPPLTLTLVGGDQGVDPSWVSGVAPFYERKRLLGVF